MIVWVGIFEPATESIPRPRRVEHVFADEEQARQWAKEMRPSMTGAYRTVQRMEVERKPRRSSALREGQQR